MTLCGNCLSFHFCMNMLRKKIGALTESCGEYKDVVVDVKESRLYKVIKENPDCKVVQHGYNYFGVYASTGEKLYSCSKYYASEQSMIGWVPLLTMVLAELADRKITYEPYEDEAREFLE